MSTWRYDIRLYSTQAHTLIRELKLNFNNHEFNPLYRGFIPLKIAKIDKNYYEGEVHDLTIDNNHNYCVPVALVHNSLLGMSEEHMVQYFTGLLPPHLKEEYDIMRTGSEYHELVQNWLASENLLIKAESVVYDVKNNVSGHVDAIIRDGYGGRGKRALEIKTISDSGYMKLKGPKYSNVGQLNFYLNKENREMNV